MAVDNTNIRNKMATDRKQEAMLVFARFFKKRLHYKVNK